MIDVKYWTTGGEAFELNGLDMTADKFFEHLQRCKKKGEPFKTIGDAPALTFLEHVTVVQVKESKTS